MFGFLIRQDGFATVFQLLAGTRRDLAQLREVARALSREAPVAGVVADSLRIQYRLSCNFAERVSKNEPRALETLKQSAGWLWGRRFFLNINTSLSNLANAYRSAIRSLDEPYATAAMMEPPREEPAWTSWIPWKNRLGRAKVDQFAAAAVRLHWKDRLLFSATRTIVALARYRAERGTLPEKLEDLVPAYLEAVPLDPYDGKPLRYLREKAIMYSVGEDLKDAGGSSVMFPDEFDKNEPTFRIP